MLKTLIDLMFIERDLYLEQLNIVKIIHYFLNDPTKRIAQKKKLLDIND